jgi:pimeloyl-ACP methyl ester carboxylesterase
MLALALAPAVVAAPSAAQVSISKVNFPPDGSSGGRVIVIGFVGGFVRPDDGKHPEVQFAAYLRHRYPLIEAEVFGNHHGGKALHQVVRLLDSDGDGVLTANEKGQSTIIIYGHSWGAAETVTLARALEQMGIPVALTIQIDTIAKPGSQGATIPANVASAINFYQTRGPLHGRPVIVAADPRQTTILGNVLMTYEDRPINCANYRWYVRVFNRPHHEIENDFRVWDRAASLIDSNLSETTIRVQTPSPSGSPMFEYLKRGFQGRIVAGDESAAESERYPE